MCPAGAGTTLTGSITMDDGADPMAPVVGASLYLSNGSCGPADTETPGGSTDADGHFLIPSIPGNCDLWLQIIAGGRHTETPVFPRSCLDTVAIVRLEDTTPCL